MTKIHAAKQRILDIYGHEPATLDELGHCMIAVLNKQSAESWTTPEKSKTGRKAQCVGLAFDVTYHERVSNSHSAPLDGETNWGNYKVDQGVPTGYPGWSGRVWVRYGKPLSSFGSEPFNATLTYTGTGGAGGYNGPWEGVQSIAWQLRSNNIPLPAAAPSNECFSWDFRFYASDWPGLAEMYEKEVAWAILAGKPKPISKHYFKWEDPEVAAADAAFNLKAREVLAQHVALKLANKEPA